MKHNWKSISIDKDLLNTPEFEDFGGIEELTDYKIISANGDCREAKRKKKNAKTSKKKMKKSSLKEVMTSDAVSAEIDMSAWCNCFVPDLVLKALQDAKFNAPTPIQREVIPLAIRDYSDILAAAETGSGKTLAFGIPILSRILALKEKKDLPWPMSNLVNKVERETKALLEEEFNDESSSDEDYKPNEEECLSEEDSEVGSPKSGCLNSSMGEKPASPITKPEEDADEDMGLVTALPEPESSFIDNKVEKIALRTCSKLPLNDTPLEAIEASFVAPDITVDMYDDTQCNDEEWLTFLRDLSQPIDEKPEEELDDPEEDPDYNALEDVANELDLLHDNNMKIITRRERDALIFELNENDGSIFNDVDDEEEPEVPEERIASSFKERNNEKSKEVNDDQTVRTGRWMTTDERLQLEHQTRMTSKLPQEKPLYSLILTPTRELAIQIKKHLQVICKYTDIKVATVVGGMAPEKQRRILKKCPEIVVATPGRLWELIEEGEPHLNQIPFVKHLVIDEADRMLEKGHFAELSQILSLLNSNKGSKRQNFVLSATLTLVHDAPKRLIFKKNQPKSLQKVKLESLINTIGMKNPKVVDITKKTALVETLTESQIMCSIDEKDIYLYYFVSVYPGRTIVFCNSIDCVRRLRTVFEYLNCNPLPLHASMHQKQRLKNLEKFASSKTAILLATDVAARGLDIKGIQHVIHYQVPRTAETYIHRSGRTARAQNEGLSLMLIEPQEGTYYKRIYKTLNKDKPLPNFPIDQNIFKVLKERVTLARAIDKSEHRIKRLSAQNRWLLNSAKEMDIDIEDENLLNDLGSEQEHAAKCREINSMKKRLKTLIQKPIIPKTLTGSYPTKSGKLMCAVSAGSENAIKALKKNKRK